MLLGKPSRKKSAVWNTSISNGIYCLMYDSLKYTTYIWPPLSLLLNIANTAPSDRQLPKAQPCSRHQQTNNEGTPHTLNPPQAKHLEHLNKTETDQNVWNERNSKFAKIKPISSSRKCTIPLKSQICSKPNPITLALIGPPTSILNLWTRQNRAHRFETPFLSDWTPPNAMSPQSHSTAFPIQSIFSLREILAPL